MIYHWLKSSFGKLKQNTIRVLCQTFFFKNGISVLKSYVISVSIKKIKFFLRKSYPTVQDMVSSKCHVQKLKRGTTTEMYNYIVITNEKNTKHSPITVNLTSMNLSFFFLFHTIFDKIGKCMIKTNKLLKDVKYSLIGIGNIHVPAQVSMLF